MQALLFDNPLAEVVDLEWKEGQGGLPSSLWETFGAMANTHGGTIEVGVDDNGVTLGLKKPEARRKEFFDTVNNRQKVSARLVSDGDVTIEERDGLRILRIRVPRANRHERPVYLNGNPMTGTYRRAGEGDYRCSEAEVRRMFADQAPQGAGGGDGHIVPGFLLDDLDDESIGQYRNRVSARTPDHPAIKLDVPEMLMKLGAMRRDRQTGQTGVTAAGLLMFGKAEAIQDPEAIPTFHLDYREAGDAPGERYKDRVTIDGTWAGNLFQFYQKVTAKLSGHPDLKVAFSLDREGVRREVTPAQEAIREALVNALIHGDHRGGGGVVVEKARDALVFGNPGMLLVSREQFFQGGVSECRNPALQRMFQMLGLGEKAGSGIDVIRKGWRAQAWRTPGMIETTRPDRVRLVMPMVSLMPEGVVSDLRRRFGEAFESLSEPEAQAVVTAEVEGSVTNPRLCEITELHPADVTKLFQKLVSNKFLVPEGYGRGMTYQVGVKAGGTDLGGSEAADLVGSEARNLGGSEAADLGSSEAPPIQAADRTREEILAYTRDTYRSAAELSAELRRNRDYLQDTYLKPMVAEGRLRLRHPEKPSHPQQAYIAVAAGSHPVDT